MALPSRDHRISVAEATTLTKRYRATGAAEQGGAFHRDQLLALLNQPGCQGLRIYHGVKADGTPALVLVGIDKDGTDMAGLIMENHFPCPPFCGAASALNT